MALQILPPDAHETIANSPIDNQLIFVILGLAIGTIVILQVAKYLNHLKINKTTISKVEKPSYTS
ncbi:hypothetical protein [Polaribacter sp.]|uniref:hypothetical protein n=1 Tax=Polaribacter sp. TaxID=1920175 RepID=UPI003F6C08DF